MFKSKSILGLVTICLFYTTICHSQTTGPTQPEVQSFQPVTMNNLVETSTGEFQYNIPLFKIGSYPINLIYNSQVGMENEATMVGLGFNLNCGTITRNVRGIPDDFKGELVIKRLNMKPNITTGFTLGTSFELVGWDKEKLEKIAGLNFSSSSGLFYNNYNGWGVESAIGAGFHGNCGALSGNAGIGISSNSHHGTSINPYFGLSVNMEKQFKKDTKYQRVVNGKTETVAHKLKVGASAGVGYDFNARSYSPKIDFPFKSVSMDFTGKAGFAGAWLEVGGEIKGYKSIQELQTNVIYSPAFGFIYADNGKDNTSAIMDFNRENEGIMTEDKPNLPFMYATPDVYSVTGQGIGGVFELKRNNVFIGFDAKAKTNTAAGGTEFEIAGGTGAHIGAMVNFGYTTNTSGKWDNGNNNLLNKIDFPGFNAGEPSNAAISELTYFKNPNDVMFNDNPIYKFTGIKPIAPVLAPQNKFGGETESNMIRVQHQRKVLNALDYFVNTSRDKRLDVIYYLTADEASNFGIQKTIPNYVLNDFQQSSLSNLSRVDGAIRKGNHLSELICKKPDGTEYVFNVPAYNINKNEVSFSLNDNSDIQNYETYVKPSLVGTVSNTGKGKDDYVSVTETPSYAHSFLLGAVLSPNYIDVDDNGPTVNDIGDFVKFNYSRVFSNYYWKSNNSLTDAAADPGYLSDPKDGKGFYTEGTKEVWYLHSIESKNEVARFYYSKTGNERTDAYDLKTTTSKLKRLDSVMIFSRPELNTNNPVPFKRIYFDYNSQTPLCKGINKNTGLAKLTLNSVYFKDGTSNKGKYSGYKFSYNTNANPKYNSLATDRWGNYKDENANSSKGINLDNKTFPFTLQNDKVNADNFAASWLLNRISLPSGGEIKIEYEAHDYAYVQNKRAMYMASIIGITQNVPSGPQASQLLWQNNIPNNYLIFKLKNPIPSSTNLSDANYRIKQDYFTDAFDYKYGSLINNGSSVSYGNIYGKFRIKLNDDFGYEDIPVFLDAEDCGAIMYNGTYDYGFVKLRDAHLDNSNSPANQIAKTAWKFVKHSRSQILFGMDADPSLSATEGLNALASMFSPAVNALRSILNTGPDRRLRNNFVCEKILPASSYIRLYEPEYLKQGGSGARVKKITITDNWSAMAGNPANSANYTTEYEYTKTLNNQKISSGVASYEPETGGEENPWKQPVFFKEKNGLMPDDNEFIMTPLGESLFPSASIIYSEVKITENKITSPNRQGAGYSINKYYTAYDFPCKTDQTEIELISDPKLKFSLLKSFSRHYMAAVQGFSVITNDMHGKPLSEETYGEKENLITGKYYRYKINNSNDLSNTVPSLGSNGTISNNKLLGVEVQVYGDSRSFDSETFSGQVHGNFDLQTPPPFPVPSIWPDLAYERKAFNSFTLTKHIRQQGILDSVIAVDKGSSVYTKNELWDDKTGAVLLSSTINEFKDPVFNFNYPAHWVYQGMGMTSENISSNSYVTNVTSPTTNFNVLFTQNFKNTLQTGDIIACWDGANFGKYVTQSVSPLNLLSLFSTSSTITFSGSVRAKIIHSGKSNLATTPIGNFTSLRYPRQLNTFKVDNSYIIVNATASEYTNAASLRCDSCFTRKGNSQQTPSTENIPFLNYQTLKILAPWQAATNYAFVDDRTQSPTINTRKDGYITSFLPFWQNYSWIKSTNPKWQFTESVSNIDHNFNKVETVNPLNIFSTLQPSNFYGMTHAMASNSKTNETLFDGFEDVETTCNTKHFQLLSPAFYSLLNSTQSHSGYYSIKTPNTGYQVTFPFDQESIKDIKIPLNRACNTNLTLFPNKKYILSAWVKESNATNTTLDYANASITVNNGVTAVCRPNGQIIDGWQRIEQEFITGSTPTSLQLSFSSNTYFDDVRIFPKEGNMKSYVYSYKDYSLMATLDENNFATFYEYDQQKQLKRIKKETEKGIMTIQEVNFGSHKQ